jgi:hypothetical protein
VPFYAVPRPQAARLPLSRQGARRAASPRRCRVASRPGPSGSTPLIAARRRRTRRDVVRPVVERVLSGGAADRWFFIRYGDPDWHLRLRSTATRLGSAARCFRPAGRPRPPARRRAPVAIHRHLRARGGAVRRPDGHRAGGRLLRRTATPSGPGRPVRRGRPGRCSAWPRRDGPPWATCLTRRPARSSEGGRVRGRVPRPCRVRASLQPGSGRSQGRRRRCSTGCRRSRPAAALRPCGGSRRLAPVVAELRARAQAGQLSVSLPDRCRATDLHANRLLRSAHRARNSSCTISRPPLSVSRPKAVPGMNLLMRSNATIRPPWRPSGPFAPHLRAIPAPGCNRLLSARRQVFVSSSSPSAPAQSPGSRPAAFSTRWKWPSTADVRALRAPAPPARAATTCRQARVLPAMVPSRHELAAGCGGRRR